MEITIHFRCLIPPQKKTGNLREIIQNFPGETSGGVKLAKQKGIATPPPQKKIGLLNAQQ